jgi:dienelactone hydrolase
VWLALGAFAVGVAFAAGLLEACTTSSSTVDGGDLLGVFEHDGGSDAQADGARGGGRGRPRGDAGRDAAALSPSSNPVARAPSEGLCVVQQGEPTRELRRTVGRPACRDAQVLEWKDADGSPRYACVVAPRGVDTRAPLPLLIFFHGPDDDPTSVDKKTGLRKLASRMNLTGEASHAGFIVLSPQGRAIRKGASGSLFDSDYVALDNVDVGAVDHFVDELLAKGLVDRRRIYALGVSVAGHMAATYAMLRADRVAAFATYGSDGPRAGWSCPGPPPPAMVLYRACDGVVGCDAVERWLRARDAQGAETQAVRLGAGDEEEPNCTVRNKCTARKGTGHHQRWPKEREERILRFLGDHLLTVDSPPPGR